jgi:hypothetical protein
MKQIQNNQKSIHTSLWILNLKKKSTNQKSRDFCQIFVISNKIFRLGYGFKNLKKIYRLAHGFLFFVISISNLFFIVKQVRSMAMGFEVLKLFFATC